MYQLISERNGEGLVLPFPIFYVGNIKKLSATYSAMTNMATIRRLLRKVVAD